MTMPIPKMTQGVGTPGGFKTQQEYDTAWKNLSATNQRLYGESPTAGNRATQQPAPQQATNMSAYGQQPSRPSNTAFADAWNGAMSQNNGGARYTPATSVIGQGQGNLAYMPPDQRPAPFTMQAYDMQGRPTSLQGQQQQRDAFISQLVSAPSNTQQYDFQGMIGRANDMVQSGWTNPFSQAGSMDQLLGALGQQAPQSQFVGPAYSAPDQYNMGGAARPDPRATMQPSSPLPSEVPPPRRVGNGWLVEGDMMMSDQQYQDWLRTQGPANAAYTSARQPDAIPGVNYNEPWRNDPTQPLPDGMRWQKVREGSRSEGWLPVQAGPQQRVVAGQAQPIQPQSQGTPYTPPAAAPKPLAPPPESAEAKNRREQADRARIREEAAAATRRSNAIAWAAQNPNNWYMNPYLQDDPLIREGRRMSRGAVNKSGKGGGGSSNRKFTNVNGKYKWT